MEIFEEDLISGAGGGKGGGGSTPQNVKDNLNSTSTAKILDVISEGEIAGFATPLEKGVCLWYDQLWKRRPKGYVLQSYTFKKIKRICK